MQRNVSAHIKKFKRDIRLIDFLPYVSFFLIFKHVIKDSLIFIHFYKLCFSDYIDIYIGNEIKMETILWIWDSRIASIKQSD
mgnify:CR=1 FL=1